MGAQVQSWDLDAGYATDLPAAMRAFSGSSSTQLSMALSGTDGRPAPALYGPWAPRATGDVVRPGQSVVHEWGLAGQTLPAFRGSVRARTAQSGTDTVTVTALDGAERLRMPAALPRPAGGIDPSSVAPTAWAASATWCVDHLLRNAGIHSAPPPRQECVLYASLHGGATANVGSLKSLAGDWSRWTKQNAPHEMAVQGSPYGTAADFVPAVRPVNRGNAPGLLYEAWVNNAGVSGTCDLEFTIAWDDGAGRLTYTSMVLDLKTGSLGAYTGPNANPEQNPGQSWGNSGITKWPGTFHVALFMKFDAGGRPTYVPRVTDAYGGVYFENVTSGQGGVVPAGTVSFVRLGFTGLRAEAVQVSQHGTMPTGAALTQRGLWQKTATLDAPDIPLRVIPQVTGTAWDVITKIAHASLATAEFDQSGHFHWRGRGRWAQEPAVADTAVTSDRELASLTVTEEIDAVRNYIRVTWDNWSGVHATDTVSNPMGNVERLLPGQYLEIGWAVRDNDYDTIPPLTRSNVTAGAIRFVNADRDNAAVVNGAVEVGVYREDGRLTLTLRNRSAATVWMRGPTGLGSVSVDVRSPAVPQGVEPAQFTTTARGYASQGAYGVQGYDHDPAGWVQDADSAAAIASALLDAGQYPCPLLTDVEILPDPRLQLGDVVRVVDRTGAALDTLAWVVGNRLSAADGAVKQTVTLRGTAYNGVPQDQGLVPDPPVRT
ncbi:hypothetical protein [Streptomyces sp. NPDC045470]|uniref:hypothetical protein n=1 Tax=Streptomyces sp. NPDC045470 TaxID=3155469 RepID=UPI0033D7EF0D